MGVMSCSRKECENIMCDIYIQSVGYVCYECRKEFEAYLKEEGLNPKTEYQTTREVEKFMDTSKKIAGSEDETTVDDFFKKHFRF